MIDKTLVRNLIASQFPKWKDLPIRDVPRSGWDNRTFRLGNHMLVRLPSAAQYATQVKKEHEWLPKLAPFLPLKIPKPLEMGSPGLGYLWNWSIYTWLEGEDATCAHVEASEKLASSLANFLIALEKIDSTHGPLPGKQNFYRGGELKTYDEQTKEALALLKGKIDVGRARELWKRALESHWDNPPVWVHGDISAGNLLIEEGSLSAILDFGILAVGDPACDLAITWTFFQGKSREIFRKLLPFDIDTWSRARGWTLWKALIVASNLIGANEMESKLAWRVIDEVLSDH